jgi:aminopeptidase N
MPRPFSPPGAPTHYLPDRPASAEHLRLEIDLDLEERQVSGRATLKLRCRRDDVRTVTLDAVEMTITEVTVDGKKTRFLYDGEKLRIEFDSAHARGDALVVTVAYKCSPRRGLYFLGPDPHAPTRPLQCWTQGQDEDSRYFWPGLDLPAEKASSEILCTAPTGLFVLSNGELRARDDLPEGRTRWHYALDWPHPAYLVTLVCGPFAEIRDRAPGTDVAVYYYAPPGREADTKRAFGRTPEMIDFFSERIGVPYPHRRYSQIAVPDFIFGGMENTTATTMTDQVLLDERAAIDHDVEGLVSHELAHQWWGNLVTCREWSEAWLNEGFATYFEYVWREHAHGRDEADVALLSDAESYFGEAAKYQRPIVCRQYDEPIELFDAHLYDKGGRVLHMLRKELGEATFWAALKTYAERHARGSVETRDLARAIEMVSGRNLDGFFAQWIGRAGHPELEVTWRWDDDRQVGTLRLEQKQSGDPFTFSVEAHFETETKSNDDRFVTERLSVRERIQSFDVTLPVRPTQVLLDPGDVLLKSLKFEKPVALWARQLEAAPLGIDRLLAAKALGNQPSPESQRALGRALIRDRFWAVRGAAAQALGKIRSVEARAFLDAGRADDNPKVRRAVANALGEFINDPAAGRILAEWTQRGDASLFVEAATALALGRTRATNAVEVLGKMLTRDAYQDVIRSRALEGLGASGDERALPVLEAAFVPEASFQVRRAALNGLTILCEGTPHARRARETLERGLDDRDFRVRMEAAVGLAGIGDPRSIPALERAARGELDGRAKRRLREAVTEIQEHGTTGEQTRKLGDEVEQLRRTVIELRQRLEKVEQSPPGSTGGKRSEVATPRRPRPPSRRGSKPGRRRR